MSYDILKGTIFGLQERRHQIRQDNRDTGREMLPGH